MEILFFPILFFVFSTLMSLYRLSMKADGKCNLSYTQILISWLTWPIAVLVVCAALLLFAALNEEPNTDLPPIHIPAPIEH